MSKLIDSILEGKTVREAISEATLNEGALDGKVSKALAKIAKKYKLTFTKVSTSDDRLDVEFTVEGEVDEDKLNDDLVSAIDKAVGDDYFIEYEEFSVDDGKGSLTGSIDEE